MTPNRWSKVQGVFAAATECAPESRKTFLEEACRGDSALMNEVVSLIQSLDRASAGFLESPLAGALPALVEEARPAARALEAGRRLGFYEILAPIGAGGMGEVYRARDSKLDRDVAIKVLPEDVAADPAARARFEREAKLVAELSHPNILSIFDFGVDGGMAYAVTELLEGETLRTTLERGPLQRERALGCALQIARGLSAAHEKGIVHRDLKPENVFVTADDHVKILDFGLSKHVDDAVPAEGASAPAGFGRTEAGRVMGTVGYMSPEQARGLPVDARSDIFAFGAILYEMVSGSKAFRRNTPDETIKAILEEEPRELSRSRPHIPGALDLLIRRCLEKNRDNRFPSARHLVQALSEVSNQTPTTARPFRRFEKIVAAAALAGVLAVAGLRFRESRKAPGVHANGSRVAVLPFENLGDAEDGYFVDGISNAVRGRLTSLPGILVIAPGSSALYKNTRKPPNDIARELDVSYLLTGTVRRQKRPTGEDGVEVVPELVEITGPGAAAVRWKQPFDAPLTEVFRMQSEITSKAARALGMELTARDERLLEERSTVNVAAYDAYLRGEENFRQRAANDTAGLERDLSFYERAVALDPDFPEAWARIAVTCSELYRLGISAPAMRERAEHAAERSATLNPDNPDVLMARSTNEQVLHRNLKRALEICAEGRRRWPTDAMILNQTANLEICLGRSDDAVEHYRQASRLDPRLNWGLGEALTGLRRYPEALEAIEHALAISPLALQLIQDKVNIFVAQGNLAGARAVLEKAQKEFQPTTLVAFMATQPEDFDVGWVLDGGQRELLLGAAPSAFGGDRGQWGLALALASALNGEVSRTRAYAEEARKGFEEQLKTQPDNHRTLAALGLALACLGHKKEAVQAGQRATTLMPVTADAYEGAVALSSLVRIYIAVGELDKALDQLERILRLRTLWTRGWLRIDPNFDPLRKSPRFQKLVANES